MRNLTLVASVRVWLAIASLRARFVAVLVGAFGFMALPAHADDDLFGMFNGLADGAANSTGSWIKLAKFGGVGCVVVGVILWLAKKKNPQISWSAVLTFIGVGCILIAIEQFIKKGQSTIQLSPVSIS